MFNFKFCIHMKIKPFFSPNLSVGSFVDAYRTNWIVADFVEEFDGDFSRLCIMLRKLNEPNVILLLSYFANLVEVSKNHFRLIL